MNNLFGWRLASERRLLASTDHRQS